MRLGVPHPREKQPKHDSNAAVLEIWPNHGVGHLVFMGQPEEAGGLCKTQVNPLHARRAKTGIFIRLLPPPPKLLHAFWSQEPRDSLFPASFGHPSPTTLLLFVQGVIQRSRFQALL